MRGLAVGPELVRRPDDGDAAAYEDDGIPVALAILGGAVGTGGGEDTPADKGPTRRNRTFSYRETAVEAERGVVDKYVGDELMALFGAPLALPDAPLYAVRAALRMRDAMERLNRDRAARGERPLGVGSGISTGARNVYHVRDAAPAPRFNQLIPAGSVVVAS